MFLKELQTCETNGEASERDTKLQKTYGELNQVTRAVYHTMPLFTIYLPASFTGLTITPQHIVAMETRGAESPGYVQSGLAIGPVPLDATAVRKKEAKCNTLTLSILVCFMAF